MVVGAVLDSGHGAALIYRSRDLQTWEYVRILHQEAEPSGNSWECPNFFEVDGQWLLIVSCYQTVEYYTGAFDGDTFEFTPRRHGILDHSGQWYAPQGCDDDQGRHVMWAWIREISCNFSIRSSEAACSAESHASTKR